MTLWSCVANRGGRSPMWRSHCGPPFPPRATSSNLCRELLGAGHNVTLLDDLATRSVDNTAGTDLRFVEGSILDENAVRQRAAEASATVHLPALCSVPRSIENPLLSRPVNAIGTLVVPKDARSPGYHVVATGSSSVYGSNPQLPKHERLLPQPMSPYAVPGLTTEAYVLAHQFRCGLKSLVFRFFKVFGPRQSTAHVYADGAPRFIDAALRGEPLTVNGDGTQSRDFTYMSTVTGIIGSALQNQTTHDTPVNLSYGGRISFLERIDRLGDLARRPLAIKFRPRRVGNAPHSQAGSPLLQSPFPSQVPVPFPDGLRATWEWAQSILVVRD